MRGMPLGVYVHVPFCATRCSYCDFNTYTGEAGRAAFAGRAVAEVRLAARELRARGRARPVATVFFGGGTPTLLPPCDLAAILAAIDGELGLEAGAEATVEANPDSVDRAALAALRAAGFTRVSLGMQSARGHVLSFLGRTHGPRRPAEAAREARDAGFEHVSLDLIYGSPAESDPDWRASLEAALAAAPDHVSAYALTVAPGTRLGAGVRLGRVAAPDEDALARRYELADALLGEHGLRWYEISNWAASPAARCRHNEGYWRGGDWWGVGPGAHSHVDGERWWNVLRPAAWAARVEAGESPVAGRERLTPEQRALERLMLGLRTAEGIDATAAPPGAAGRLAADGLLREEGGRLVLTLRGRLVADLVTRELAAPPRRGRRGARSGRAPARA
jgi:putative oxygen-independent coproporphyrinogen III oxidase